MQLNVTVKIVIKLFRRYTRHWNLFIIQFNDFLSLCTYCKQTVLVADRRSSTDIGSVQRLTQAQPSAINVLLPCAVTRYSKKPQKRNDRKLECQQLWDLNAYHLFWLDPFFFFYSLFFFWITRTHSFFNTYRWINNKNQHGPLLLRSYMRFITSVWSIAFNEDLSCE